MKTIRRFPRRPTDAHLLTPPDTQPFTVHLVADEHLAADDYGAPVRRLIMNELGFRDHWPEHTTVPSTNTPGNPLHLSHRGSTQEMIRSLISTGKVERIDTWEEHSERAVHIRITRRPKISPKLLANLTPLQRQRMPKQSTP